MNNDYMKFLEKVELLRSEMRDEFDVYRLDSEQKGVLNSIINIERIFKDIGYKTMIYSVSCGYSYSEKNGQPCNRKLYITYRGENNIGKSITYWCTEKNYKEIEDLFHVDCFERLKKYKDTEKVRRNIQLYDNHKWNCEFAIKNLTEAFNLHDNERILNKIDRYRLFDCREIEYTFKYDYGSNTEYIEFENLQYNINIFCETIDLDELKTSICGNFWLWEYSDTCHNDYILLLFNKKININL